MYLYIYKSSVSLQNSVLMHNIIPEFSIIFCYMYIHFMSGSIRYCKFRKSRTHTYFAPVFSLLETVPGHSWHLLSAIMKWVRKWMNEWRTYFSTSTMLKSFGGLIALSFVFLPLFLYFLEVWLLKFYGFKINTWSK